MWEKGHFVTFKNIYMSEANVFSFKVPKRMADLKE